MAIKEMLNPGSDDARKQGCSCPKDENQGGQGATIASAQEGRQYFCIDADCEIHGFRS